MTRHVSAYTAGFQGVNVSTGSSDWTDVQNLSITARGGEITILFSVAPRARSHAMTGHDLIVEFEFRLRRDGSTTVWSSGDGLVSIRIQPEWQYAALSYSLADTPSAGAHSYVLQARARSSQTAGIRNTDVGQRSMILLERLR